MGRAERRRTERTNRLEDRKGKILLTHEEFAKAKEEAAREARNEATKDAFRVFATCMAVKDIRKNKYGKKRLIDNLAYMDDLMNALLDGDENFADYEKEVFDKGVIINCRGKEV